MEVRSPTIVCEKCGISKPFEQFPVAGGIKTLSRRNLMRQMVAIGHYSNARAISNALAGKGIKLSLQTTHSDLNGLGIKIRMTDAGQKLTLPQSLNECVACQMGVAPPEAELQGLVPPEPIRKPIVRKKSEFSKAVLQYCRICECDRPVDIFEGKTYCGACGDMLVPTIRCEMCQEARQPIEMMPGETTVCIYCVLERNRRQDVLQLKKLCQGNEMLKNRLEEYISRKACT